jgi:hypothetical protein
MIKFFIGWITLQLVLIGIAGVSINNEIIDKTYVCKGNEKVSVIYGALLPLTTMIPNTKQINDYCHY